MTSKKVTAAIQQPISRSIAITWWNALPIQSRSSETITAPAVATVATRPLARRVVAQRHLHTIHTNRCASSTLVPSVSASTIITSTLLLVQSPPPPPLGRRLLFFSSSSPPLTDISRHKHIILTHALSHVHDDGWTDDAIASGTLDANLPPAYIGIIGDGLSSSMSSALGNADLVAFFMDSCNDALKLQLVSEAGAAETTTATKTMSMTSEEYITHISSCINYALRTRLAMVLPFVKSKRWHEGMAIGALPQNAIRTIHQLDAMATIVLDYAVRSTKMQRDASMNNIMKIVPGSAAQRTAIVAAYAAAELHLLSEGSNIDNSTSNIMASSNYEDRFLSTWTFLEHRSAEVARILVGGGMLPPVPHNIVPTHPMQVITATTAVVASLAGATLSLASPATAAAVAGVSIPNPQSVVTSALNLFENVIKNTMFMPQSTTMRGDASSSTRGYGTRPSDYTTDATVNDNHSNDLPPFDPSEEIFSRGEERSRTK